MEKEKAAMTKERLKSYQSKKAEIEELRYRREHLGDGDSMVGNDVIFDYRTGQPRPQSVVGIDHKKEESKRERYDKQIEKLQRECEEIEEWVEAIPDSLTRRIARMCYIEGMRQDRVARKVHLAQSKVSERISKKLKEG